MVAGGEGDVLIACRAACALTRPIDERIEAGQACDAGVMRMETEEIRRGILLSSLQPLTWMTGDRTHSGR